MNLVLIGFMASGKTAVGRRVARKLGYRFLDTDQFIEAELGRTISDIFATEGEAYFRALESRLARSLGTLHNHVIATGGGMALAPGNLEALRQAGPVIFLRADPAEIIRRLERDTRRPKVQGGDLEQRVRQLYGERMPTYVQADVVIDTAGKSVNWVAGEVLRQVGRFLGTRQPPGPPPAGPQPDPAPAPDAGATQE